MDALYQYSVEVSAWLQTLGWLEPPMRFFTFLGKQEFFVFALPVIYWCIDSALGIRVGFMLLLGNGINEFAKMAVQGPRPYWISGSVKGMAPEPSFGTPSSHAQLAVNVWGLIAAAIRKPWAWIAAVALIFFIGASRSYMGVHFVHDVLLGWLLGIVTLWAFLRWWTPVTKWLRGCSFAQQLLLSLVLPAVFLLANGLLVYANRNYVLPEDWMVNAMRAGEPYPEPYSLEGTIASAGTLLGFGVGLAFLARGGGFQAGGPIWKRALCFLVGIIGVAVLYLGLKAVFPDDASLIASALRMLRYALIGWWVAAGAPWLFRRLGLVPRAS